MDKCFHLALTLCQQLFRLAAGDLRKKRRCLPFALTIFFASQALAVNTVTVEQLERALNGARSEQDAVLTRKILEMQLVERLSAGRLARLEATLPGPRSHEALIALADMSAFMPAPAAEIPAIAKPDTAAQRQMIALTIDYVTRTLDKLPNFYATRVTTSFQDTPWDANPTSSLMEVENFVPPNPLRHVDEYNATVLYRKGKEVAHDERAQSGSRGLTTSGEFGPTLRMVLLDAAQGNLAWSHWEQGDQGLRAVYGFAVTAEKSHYSVAYCCTYKANGDRSYFEQISGYRGEISIDPSNGTVSRIVLKASLKPENPIVRANIVVEYGPVELGGRTYICPVKGIALSLAREVTNRFSDQPPWQVSLNDVVFQQYHLYGASTRLLTGDAEPAENGPSSVNTQPVDVASNTPPSASAASNEASIPPSSTAPVEKSARHDAAESATGKIVARPVPATNPGLEPVVPEISITAAAGLPDATQSSPANNGYSLRVASRLVDVDVAAYDKKGHPLTDLEADELEIYDNGRKQRVLFFTPASGTLPENASSPDGSPKEIQTAFSNRRASITSGSMAGIVERNITVLLIDANHLANADMTNTRRQISDLLRHLPENEHVALYALQANGLQVLQEPTADRELLAAKLSRWSPAVRATAQSQQEENRKRQQIDTVRSASDLQSVNGNMSQGPDTAATVDPVLRDEGNNSTHDALSMLASVAAHLAAIPGHKNLIWITSDNALADFADRAVSSDKGAKHLEGVALNVQEALNDARTSIYPLDASQLETMAIDSSLKNANVEVSPGTMTGPQAQGGGATTGRITAEMQQDLHTIQAPIRQLAEGTGGRAIARSSDLAAAVNRIVVDGRASYSLSFTPDQPADGQYHQLVVKISNRKGISLRYRTGYLYAKDPVTLKDRVRKAISQPLDVSEIALTANPVSTPSGATLKLKIATNDLSLTQQDQRWVGKFDIFLVQREEGEVHARVSGQVIGLHLLPATYQGAVVAGIPFDQQVQSEQKTGSIRVVIVDEASGRIGSVTIPAKAMEGKWH
jgi:VWFA-related protein